MQGVAGPPTAIADQFGSENNIGRWNFLTSLDAPMAWVDRIIVNREFRSRGLGTELLKQAFQVFRESGIRYVVLSPRPERMEDTERLDRFYEKFGFREVREFEGERLWNNLMMLDLASIH